MKFYRFAKRKGEAIEKIVFEARLQGLMPKERSACKKRMLLRKFLLFLTATVLCGIYLILICLKAVYFVEGVAEAVAIVLLVLLALGFLIVFGLICSFIDKKLPAYGIPLPDKILIAKCSEPLREFYSFGEPYLLTKCYACTDERWNNHDVCLFFDRGHLCITADIIHGFTHSYQDLGCYQFEPAECSLQYAEHGDKTASLLTADRFAMYLGKRAKPFICRNLTALKVSDTLQKKESRMRHPKCSDALLWRSIPEGADIVRAFFSEDRERRILVYRRKDGTYSYTDQALTFDEYEQEYWWWGTDNELSFYESEQSVLSDIAPLLDGMTEYR